MFRVFRVFRGKIMLGTEVFPVAKLSFNSLRYLCISGCCHVKKDTQRSLRRFQKRFCTFSVPPGLQPAARRWVPNPAGALLKRVKIFSETYVFPIFRGQNHACANAPGERDFGFFSSKNLHFPVCVIRYHQATTMS